jgi:hypothetical protein
MIGEHERIKTRHGGRNAQPNRPEAEARAFAKYMRPVLAELEAFSATETAAILNERGLPSAGGRKWTALQVVRVAPAPRTAGRAVIRWRAVTALAGAQRKISAAPAAGTAAGRRGVMISDFARSPPFHGAAGAVESHAPDFADRRLSSVVY